MKYDLTILIPGFRTILWENLYKSAENACKKYNWEILFISPFELPDALKDKNNVSLIRDFGTVPRCVQLGIQKIQSKLFFLTVDDCVFAKDSIDKALDEYYAKCTRNDAMAMLYSEDGNMMPKEYWTVLGPPGRPDIAAPLRLPGIDRSWRIANQCLMSTERFIELGGLDCINFQYLDKPIHDFMFRLQRDGGKIYFSPMHVCLATHFPLATGDHGPIDATSSTDTPYFNMIYSNPHLYKNRIKINFDNWKKSNKVWKGRFIKGISLSYEELCEREGYDMVSIKLMKKKLEERLKCELG